jgi:AsmA-like C-terminal region
LWSNFAKHSNPLRTLKKVIIYLSLTIAVVLIGLTLSVYFYKDRIIQQFIREANKNLNTPVKVGKVDISAWNDFPNLAIVFSDVYIEDSHPGEYPLFTATTVSFYLNPIEAWRGDYSVRGLQITGSETNLKIDPTGLENFIIVKPQPEKNEGSISFDLKNVRLKGTKVSFHDQQTHLHHIFSSEKLIASISLKDDLYDILAKGDVTTNQIGIGNSLFLKDKLFDAEARLEYDDVRKNLLIKPSLLTINKSSFDVKGNYNFKQKNLIDLDAAGKKTDFQTLLSLMPQNVVKDLIKYQSAGNVYFNVSLKGEIGEHHSPFVSLSFGCKNARFYHPDYQSKIEHANLEGSFASPSMTDLSHAQLFLRKINGELNGKAFDANFSIKEFNDPVVALDFKGNLDAGSILNFYPIPGVKKLSGEIKADVSFDGKISLLKRRSTAQRVRTRGLIDMRDLQLTIGKEAVNFKNLNGTLQFNNNDLALSDVRGQLERSDFQLNGFFKNVITFLLFEDQPIGIETDLTSNLIDLDQLFELGFGAGSSQEINFHISPDLHLNFNCNVKVLKYKRFLARDLKGDLLVKNQMAVSRNITLRTMGGDLSVNGIVDSKNSHAIDVVSSFKLNGIHVDSIFYIFHDFDQTFIESKHLKGQTTADVSLEMTLNEKLNLYPETLIADIGAVIKNGELNHFEPMQALKKYLDDEGLSQLRFADLKNDIHIENKTILIPQMEVRSNVTTISLSGTHTFDQHIDYRVVAPLHNKKKIDSDEAFGAIEQDNAGRTKVFLKIVGTTSKYTVSYDKAAVKKKIVSDLKKEVNELKDAFRAKGKKKKKEVELEKEEYFDWDDKDKKDNKDNN